MSINPSEPSLTWASQQAAVGGFANVEEYLEPLLKDENGKTLFSRP